MLSLLQRHAALKTARINGWAGNFYDRVAEYWVVDIPNQRIHVMSKIVDGRYPSIEICVPPKQLAPLCKPDALLPTAELFNFG